MPDEPFKPRPVPPRPSVGAQLFKHFVRREPVAFVITGATYLHGKAAREIEGAMIGGDAGADKVPGEGIIPKKIAQEVGNYFLPGYQTKAISEIGEGEIPFTQKAQRAPGLGVGEEAAIARENEIRRRAFEGLRAEQLAAFGAVNFFGRTVAAGTVAATPARLFPVLVRGTRLQIEDAPAVGHNPDTATGGSPLLDVLPPVRVASFAPSRIEPQRLVALASAEAAQGVRAELPTEYADP